jgi:hypothetical protein
MMTAGAKLKIIGNTKVCGIDVNAGNNNVRLLP